MSDLLLLVEDDDAIATMFGTALRHAGWRVEVARDGRAGLEAAKRAQPAAVLLDMALPRMDGAQVLEALRADPATRHLPVIVLSNSEVKDWQRTAHRLGARWMVKSWVLPPDLARTIADEIGPPAERRRLPRRLADVLQVLESGIEMPGGQLPASLAAQLLVHGVDLESHATLEAVRAEVAARVAQAAPSPDRRRSERRGTGAR